MKLICALDEKSVIIGLDSDYAGFISGFANVTLLYGNCQINGFSLVLGEIADIRFPTWIPSGALVASSGKTVKVNQLSKVKKLLGKILSESELSLAVEAVKEHGSFPTIILMQGCDKNKLDWLLGIEDCFERFSTLSNTDINISVKSAMLADVGTMTRLSIDVTYYPASWISSLDNFANKITSEKSLKSIVCGAKGVGKSTLLVYAINRLLSNAEAIAVIDCDVGQPEFNVPGIVSLHIIHDYVLSPAHLHLHQFPAVLSFYLGELSTKSSPDRFSEALSMLYNKYKELSELVMKGSLSYRVNRVNKSEGPKSSSNMFDVLSMSSSSSSHIRHKCLPLLVNCDGNIRYMGNEILSAVVSFIQPDVVFHIASEKDRILPAIHRSAEDFQLYRDQGRNSSEIIYDYEISTLEPGKHCQSKIAAVELRNLRLISYFLSGNSFLQNIAKISTIYKDQTCDSSESEGCQVSLSIKNACVVDPNGLIAIALKISGGLNLRGDSVVVKSVSEDLSESLVLEAIEASLVGITAVPDDSRGNIRASELLPCIGLGFVNEVNIINSLGQSVVDNLVIVPSTVPAVMNALLYPNSMYRCLVHGRLPVPLSFLFSKFLISDGFLSSEYGGEGVHTMKHRNNVKRKRLNN